MNLIGYIKMEYKLNIKASNKINSFYQNVARKYRNTWSKEDVKLYILQTKQSIYQIENGLLRRQPTLSRWNGLFMANSNDRKWFFAYRIDGDTIYVEDACHAQNMHESKNAENLLWGVIMEEVRKCLHLV